MLCQKSLEFGGVMCFLLASTTPTPVLATDAGATNLTINNSSSLKSNNDEFGTLRKETISSLKYQKRLGKGTFKKVYSVMGNEGDINAEPKYYAMAVERLRSKSEARDELRGIRIVEDIQAKLAARTTRSASTHDVEDLIYFESIYAWWIQSAIVAEYTGVQIYGTDSASTSRSDPYSGEGLVFPTFALDQKSLGRTRKRPTSQSFVKNRAFYLISFKPLYDMDLKRFAGECHEMYPISKLHYNDSTCSSQEEISCVGGVPITEAGALKLVYEICHAGRIMHDDLGIVHRDIKPKNIMLSNGHIVIIDFGFADFGERVRSSDGGETLCITEVGKIKGEVNYAVADDVALYRGCREGDSYAFGRIIFEVLFGPSSLQSVDMDSGKK
jgi:serine/threonine protein kinase